MPDTQTPVSVDQLQFQRAEAVPGGSAAQHCVACKHPVLDTYFHAAGQVVCAFCADRIQKGQQAPPAASLARAALYGGGAALAGSAIYATVAIITGWELGLIAILVGVMVGKAIRHASGGLGGRHQQILAVLLTYFAITTSYIPVFIHEYVTKPKPAAQAQAVKKASDEKPPMSPGTAVVFLIALAAVAPFLSLAHGSGIITLFIIFIGLRQAWQLTARRNISVTGPYPMAPAAAGG